MLEDSLKILIIEDSIQDYFIIKEYIKRIDSFDAELTHCESLTKAQILLADPDSNFDLIFLDLFLGDSFGRDSFLQLKQIVDSIPIVVLSGVTDKNTALEIVQLGAQEYIVKGDFDELLIEKAIIYSIERYRFQRRLQVSEERHRLTFKNAGVALGEYDATELMHYVQELKKSGLSSPDEYQIDNIQEAMKIRGMIKLIMVNNEALRLFEMTSKSDFEVNYEAVHTQDSVVIFKKLFSAIWNEEDSYEVITRYKRKNSKENLSLLSRVSLFGYDQGKCSLIKSGTDITELVNKEKQVARQNKLAETLSNSTMALIGDNANGNELVDALALQGEALEVDYICISNVVEKPNGHFIERYESWFSPEVGSPTQDGDWLYNTSLEALGVGMAMQEMLNRGTSTFTDIEKEEENGFLNLMKRLHVKSICVSPVIVKNKVWAAVMYVNFNRNKEWLEEEVYTVKSFSSSLGSYIARNQAENQLLELNEQLETRIDKRTEDLTEAMSELESFSYSVSHDLRAPLRKVGGFSQILEKEFSADLPERAKHLLTNIKDGALEMSQLIHDLLEFSKLGRQDLSFTTIDMEELCRSITEETVHMFPNQNIQLKMPTLPAAKGDRNLVKHAASNLIWNAVKFSSKNEVIEIEINCSSEGNMNVYSISDNGIGIDMKYAHKIFDVFQRLHTKDQYEGTGVGLAIVKRIIKKHHGKVSVNGELGKGTTFSFSLPSAETTFSKLPIRKKQVTDLLSV